MLTSIAPTRTGRRSRRRKIVPPQPAGTPIYIVEADASGSAISLILDQPVILNGLPGFTVGSAHVISATQAGPTEIDLTFSGSTTGGEPLILPFQDGAIRNASGGYVASNQFPVG